MPDYPLPSSNPQSLGFAQKPLEHLDHLIRQHIEEGRYPGAQIALARNGQLALFRTYGDAKTEGGRAPANGRHAVPPVQPDQGVDQLGGVGPGRGRPPVVHGQGQPTTCRSSPRRGKADITLHQVMTHQGGFPSGDVTPATWTDHARMRAEVCDFSLDWTPGIAPAIPPARRASDPGDGDRGGDRPGLPRRDPRQGAGAARARRRHLRRRAAGRAGAAAPTPMPPKSATTRPSSRRPGMPSGGGYATARGMAAFYQMLLGQGRLGEVRMFSPRLISYVTKKPYRRARRRRDGRHPDASRPRAPCPRRQRAHPRPRHARRAADLRPWRRRHVLFLGRPDERRVVHLPHQLHAARPVALGAARPHRQSGARRDRLTGAPLTHRPLERPVPPLPRCGRGS